MSKVLIEEFHSEASEQNLPLVLHFAKIHSPFEETFKESEILNRSDVLVKRYRTSHYLPVNKFYKSISRTLDD